MNHMEYVRRVMAGVWETLRGWVRCGFGAGGGAGGGECDNG